jgi:hypothetical protein
MNLAPDDAGKIREFIRKLPVWPTISETRQVEQAENRRTLASSATTQSCTYKPGAPPQMATGANAHSDPRKSQSGPSKSGPTVSISLVPWGSKR